MEHLVSPLTNSPPQVVHIYPLLDDPYAHITQLGELTKHNYHYILKKIEHGWITDRDIEIVNFVSVHRWVTLSQIFKIFFPDVEREETVRNRIRKMMKYGLLRKIEWSSYSKGSVGRPSFYEIGASGADILKFRFGAFLGHRDPRNPKPTTMLFRMKYIATNELYLQLREHFKLVHFEFHPILKLQEEQQVPTAKFTLINPVGKEMSFILLCHREEEKWLKTIRYQAMFYKQYLKNSEGSSIMIVHVSTTDKANLVSKIFEQEGLSTVWFVTDEDLFDKDMVLTKSFFFFSNGEKVYYDLQ
ncbi:replication-relaxation family protein [Paenibacillus sp. 1A_MP2]|uniref:replication-relaxation family protein n=1 Tax=Paenibacillus sp. 1A_MP2 TaxID=3457495 RepID=UPI003FCC31D5